MSPDTDKKMTRRRAGIALAVAGVCAAVPIGIVAAQSAGTPAGTTVSEKTVTPGGLVPGERVPAEKTLPKVLSDELAKQDGPVVAGFVLPGINEDERVADWLASLRKDPKFSDTTVLIYRITPRSRLKDIPEVLDMTSTPVVAVFQKDGKIAATWRGIVDNEMLAQSVIDARKNIPGPVKLTPSSGGPEGDAAGIALAKKVNRHYGKVPLVVEKIKGTDRFPLDKLTAMQDTEATHVLQKGKIVGIYQVGTTADGEKFQVIMNRKGAFAKRESMSCWVRSNPPGLGDVINQPVMPLQAFRFGKPYKSKKRPGQLIMKVWAQGKSQPGWIVRVDAKTFELISLRRDRVTSTIGTSAEPSSSTVKPVKPSTNTKTSKSSKSANPMASWPSTLPTCADIG